jgi:hypothetical protein
LAPGATPALSPEDSALLARYGRGEIELGAPSSAPTSTPAAAPSGAGKSVVPPVPEGFTPVYDPLQVEQFVARQQALQIPSGAAEGVAARLREGDMLYRNPKTGESRWMQMPGGIKDIAGQITAGTAGQTAGATAPFKGPTPITIQRPGGPPETMQMIQNPDGSFSAAPVAAAAGGSPGAAGGPAGAPGGGGAAIGTPVGGWQVEPAQAKVQQLSEQNETASRQLTTLGEIRDLMGSIDTGPLAEHKAELGAKLKAFGVDSGTVDRVLGPVDSAEALRKAFWNLGTSQVSANLGGHPAGYVVEQGLSSNPNIALQPGANELMTNMLGVQARRTQDQYRAASGALGATPQGGYGPGGVYGAVNNAILGVSDKYHPEAMLGAARMMTKGQIGGWTPDMYDANTGAPTPKGQAALDLIPTGSLFYSATGKPLRKDANGKIAPVQ